MPLSLTKGGNLSLSKEAPQMTVARVGLGWEPRSNDGAPFDLDAQAFLLGDSGKVRSDGDFVFFNQLASADGTVKHTGDSRDGEGDGDDEVLIVNLSQVDQSVQKIVFTVTIHSAAERRQNFGMVSGAFIRVLNDTDKAEIVRYDLTEDASTATVMTFGELYRNGGEWKFRATGESVSGDLFTIARVYGVSV
jgi:tellurium resistance protein TerD